MPTAPYSDLRLKPGEWPDQARLQFLHEGLAENTEDIYERLTLLEAGLGIEASFATKKTITGSVNSLGVLTSGSGFTSAKTATGIYKITVTAGLSSVGVMDLTKIAASGDIWYVEPTKKIFVVEAVNFAGSAADTAFSFVIRQT